jgi:hypothetical protein
MEAVHISEMLVYFSETIQHYIPESCHLRTHCSENLTSHKVFVPNDLRMGILNSVTKFRNSCVYLFIVNMCRQWN